MCHVSHAVTCHVSHVTFLFSDKVVKLIGVGSLINGAYPVWFFQYLTINETVDTWTFLSAKAWPFNKFTPIDIVHIFTTWKLDRIGPVGNRPSTDKPHHFVQKKKEKKTDTWHLTPDTWHVTPYTWILTHGTWHMTSDMWHMVGVEYSLKISPL